MPKVGSDTYTIKGKLTQLDIYYTQKNGFEYRPLPDEFIKMMDWDRRRFYSEGELKSTFEITLSKYHEAIKKQRKVIMITLKGSTNLIMNPSDHGTWCGIKEGVSKHFESLTNAPDYTFGFKYKVVYELQGQHTSYYHIQPNGEIGTQYRASAIKEKVIDWTPEREQYLKDLGDKVQQLIYNISSVFDNPKVLEIMDTQGIKALENKSIK